MVFLLVFMGLGSVFVVVTCLGELPFGASAVCSHQSPRASVPRLPSAGLWMGQREAQERASQLNQPARSSIQSARNFWQLAA